MQLSTECYTPEMLKILAVVGELTDKVFPKQDKPLAITDEQLDDIAELAYTSASILRSQYDGVPRRNWVDLMNPERQIAKAAVRRVLNNPLATPDELHDKWVRRQRGDGWTYGTSKDNFARKHPELLPYKYLSVEKKRADLLFFVTVHTLYSSLKGSHD